MLTIRATTPLPSLTRPADAGPVTVPPLRIGVVQHRWQADTDALLAELTDGIATAAAEGASIVFLPEITLSRYPADTPGGPDAYRLAEDLQTGPTVTFAAAAAREHGVFVVASLFERADSPEDSLGLNTAVLVAPSGEVVGRTRKLHIPVSAGYEEHTYFRQGPADAAGTGGPAAITAEGTPYPVYADAALPGLRLGMPTCWDEWFAEVARSYSLASANAVVYPTAIGSEPTFPEVDTQPLWQQVIVGNGIANALFMIVPNRWGDEGAVTFYGSSFVSDPYGRVLAQAPRDESAVLVVDLPLEQREDWLSLFPFLATRRPDTYGALTDPVTEVYQG